jgi:hypothetical protein
MSVPAVSASGPSLTALPPPMPSAAAIASGNATVPPVANKGLLGKMGNAFSAVMSTAKSAVGLSGGARRRRGRGSKHRGTKRRASRSRRRASRSRKH